MTGSVHILQANARDLPIADDSVDLVVTSPPYFGLRSYQDAGEHYDGQIGAESSPDAFVTALLEVTAECMRVLKPSGSLWVNLGDKYAAGPTGSSGSTAYGQRTVAELATSVRRDFGGVPHKSLVGIPWRYALRCVDELGLILRAEVIWSKPNGLPESVTDRVRRSHEQWFHFTLQPRYFSAVDEIRDPHQGGGSGVSTAQRQANGTLGANRGLSAGAYQLMQFAGNPLGKLPNSVWTIPTEGLQVPAHLGVDHYAAFPIEWPRRIIQGWAPAGVCTTCGEGRRPVTERYVCACTPHHDEAGQAVERTDDRATGLSPRSTRSSLGAAPTVGGRRVYHFDDWTPAPTEPGVVLDPFGGTGTTALVAKALGRHGISVDMSSDYCRIAEWRTSDPGELARAMRVAKPARQVDGQESLLDLLGGEGA